MSDNVDVLLSDVDDVSDYDIRDDEEDALLQDDEAIEEAADVLDLNMDDNLNDDDYAYNVTNDIEEESSTRDKFTSERVECLSLPDPKSQPYKVPFKQPQQMPSQQSYNNNNRGRFPRRNQRGGHFRGNMRGRGIQRGYHNVQNKNFIQKPRPEGNKYFINPHFKGNVKIQNNAWNKKPVMAITPWANQPPQQHTSNFQNGMPPTPVHQVRNPPFQQPIIQQVIPQIKPPVHQRLGYSNPPPSTPQVINSFVHPPPMQPPPMQPPSMVTHQITPHKFEEDRIVTINTYNQQPPIFQPPPMQQQHPQPHFQQQPQQQPQQQQQQSFNQPMGYHNCPIQYNPPPQNNYPPPQAQYPMQPQWQPPQPQWQPPAEPQVPHNVAYEPPVNFVDNNYNANQNFQLQNPPPFSNHQQQQYPQPNLQQNFNQRSQSNFNQGNETYYNSQQVYNMKNQKYVVKLSPNKRTRGRNHEDDGIKRRIFENSNLQEITTVDFTISQIAQSRQVVPEEDEETRKYRKKIEAQKRLREELLQKKEERRKIAAQIKLEGETCAGLQIAPAIINTAPFNENIQSLQENKVEKDQLKSFLTNRKIIAKDQSLVDTSVVVVSNLAAGTSEVKLRKLCQGVREIKNFELSSKERQATIQFNSVASAHAFYKRYQRFMLDLSMIQVTLKQ